MRKIIKRFLAYTIDMMVVLLITQSISGIPVINKQLANYTKYYNEYTEYAYDYAQFKVQLTKNFEDEELSQNEYDKLVETYPDYKGTLDKYYEDEKLTKKEYTTFVKKIDNMYTDTSKVLYYQIEKNSIMYFVIYLIAVVLYFIGFNKLTNGQTLGKKLFRLRVVNSKDSSLGVSVWSYLIRAILLYQPINYIVKLIGVYTLNQNDYYTVTSIIYNLQYYLEFIIGIMIMIRADGRGLHDLLARTRVVLLDKFGKEIEEPTVSLISKKLDTNKSKTIVEEPSE